MLTLSKRHQIAVGVVLFGLMAVSRGYHFPVVQSVLPSASWAVFFLAGVYLRSLWVPVGLFVLASLIDFAAINWQGVSDYCVSPAYIALIPAYGALWLSGRWFAGRYSFKPATLLTLVVSALVGTVACELISSGAFYFFSGRFPETTLAEFGARLVKYAPHGLSSMAFWIGVVALAHTVVVSAYNNLAKPKLT
jgi:hypothetical protein